MIASEKEREKARDEAYEGERKTVIKEKLCRVDHEYVVSNKLYTTCYNVPFCASVCYFVFIFQHSVSSFSSIFRSFFLFSLLYQWFFSGFNVLALSLGYYWMAFKMFDSFNTLNHNDDYMLRFAFFSFFFSQPYTVLNEKLHISSEISGMYVCVCVYFWWRKSFVRILPYMFTTYYTCALVCCLTTFQDA